MAVALTSLSHGAGCGCKIGAADLRAVVAGLPTVDDPRVLVGTATSDDALGVVEALRLAELLHGGLDLGLRVFAAERHQGIIGPRCPRP